MLEKIVSGITIIRQGLNKVINALFNIVETVNFIVAIPLGFPAVLLTGVPEAGTLMSFFVSLLMVAFGPAALVNVFATIALIHMVAGTFMLLTSLLAVLTVAVDLKGE